MNAMTGGAVLLVIAVVWLVMIGRAITTGKADFYASRDRRVRRSERPTFFWLFVTGYLAMAILCIAGAFESIMRGQ